MCTDIIFSFIDLDTTVLVLWTKCIFKYVLCIIIPIILKFIFEFYYIEINIIL